MDEKEIQSTPLSNSIPNQSHEQSPDDLPNPNLNVYKFAYEKFLSIVSSKGQDIGSMLIFVATGCQIVQNLKNGKNKLTSEEKKAIVKKMIKQWIDESSSFSDKDKEYLKQVWIPLMLDGVIDSLCQLNVHKAAQKATTRCLAWFCGADVINSVEEKEEEKEKEKEKKNV